MSTAELTTDLYGSLYEFAEPSGLVIRGRSGRPCARSSKRSRNVRKGDGPTLEKIQARKLAQEIGEDEAASEWLLEGRRMGRTLNESCRRCPRAEA